MKKPNLSFWEIWNMSFGFMGIQFGFALQIGNVSRIFETLGAKIDDLAILWVAGPVTGLLVQPIVGYFSDRTWGQLGRRRPYFLVGAILSTLALFIMPNSPTLWIAAGMLWIMDAAFNITMEPFRAFVGDNLNKEQRTQGFTMQSFFIGIGAVIASLLPWIFANLLGISNTAAEGEIPSSVKWSFYFGAIALLLSVLWTVFKSKEYSPEELEAFEKEEEKEHFDKAERSPEAYQALGTKLVSNGGIIALLGLTLTLAIINWSLTKELLVITIGLIAMGGLFALAGQYLKRGDQQKVLPTMVVDLLDMPKTMKQLAWVQFFSWFALFAMWIYTTAAVTRHIYGSSDTTSALYNEGADWVGVCFAVYNGITILAALYLPILAARTSRKFAHFLCLVIGGVSLASIGFFNSPMLLLLPMIGIGIAWASILSMPYAILTGSLPAAKMGYYMGTFNFFIVIPQMVAAAVLGFFLDQFFGGDPLYALIIGGFSMILAGLLTMRVEDN